ncbi:MAG: hypothetical protein LBD85_02280 [Oscillospiraceae bacterium]|jgi:arginine/lysine/ornithine decarboxylase|nr:hypothetical protein [Oscillospiraceae bacterium]
MLIDALNANDRYPLHMPGHKRNPEFAPQVSIDFDVTEIEGLDDLAAPTGVIAGIESLAARIYGSRKAFLLVNGSTCGNLAAIRAAHILGASRISLRGVPHSSVINAIELCGMDITLDSAAPVVLVTSPSYEGEIADIASIADEVHSSGGILIVDSAHGAHLGFHPYFPENAVRLGADLVIESLHKTLPALSQVSLLHVCGDRIEPELVKRQVNVFQTTSPGYLLIQSAEHCLTLLDSRSRKMFSDFALRLRRLYSETGLIPQDDPSKILVPDPEFAKILRLNGFEPERVTKDYTLLIMTICDPDWVFDRLITLLKGILK